MMTTIIAMLLAQASPQGPAAMVDALADCLKLEDRAARSACLEPAARALVDAAARREVLLVTRDDIRKTRRSLFGLGGEPADLLTGGTAPAAERIETLETKLVSAAPIGNERWSIRLEEGGSWQTTEPWALGSDPRRDTPAIIRRAALGSYTLKIPGARAVRVRRVN